MIECSCVCRHCLHDLHVHAGTAAAQSPEPSPTSLFDTPSPSVYQGSGGQSVPTVDGLQFHFTPRVRADAEQPLFTYPEGFPAVECTNDGQIYNISFAKLFRPGADQDYNVHLSQLTPYPNNISGIGCGTCCGIIFSACTSDL